MEIYLLKFVGISGICWLFYMLLLTREPNHHFKRFFLLITPLAALSFPAFSLRILPETPSNVILSEEPIASFTVSTAAENPAWNLEKHFLVIWGLISLLLLIRFSYYLYRQFRALPPNEVLENGLRIRLSSKIVAPYSFLNWIIVSEADYRNGSLPKEILRHEAAHIRQRHTLDLIYFEIIIALFWFNPFFYLLRRELRFNHEHLADAAAVEEPNQIAAYQKILLNSLTVENSYLSHQFTFNNTKKRFSMMYQKKTRRTVLSSALALPVAAALLLGFAEKLPARSSKVSIFDSPPLLKKDLRTDLPMVLPKSATVVEKPAAIVPLPKFSLSASVSKSTQIGREETVDSALINENKETKVVETPPEFPGGNSVLLSKLAEAIDIRSLPVNSANLSSKVIIVVSAEGFATEFRVTGDNSQFNTLVEKAAKSTLEGIQWKPGTRDGVPARSFLQIPVTLKIS